MFVNKRYTFQGRIFYILNESTIALKVLLKTTIKL